MAKDNGQGQRERRRFTAEFKLEAVPRVAERRAAGVPMTQIARELDVRDFPGNGRLPREADEVRRLEREVARLKQELAFVKSAAAYFARESR